MAADLSCSDKETVSAILQVFKRPNLILFQLNFNICKHVPLEVDFMQVVSQM